MEEEGGAREGLFSLELLVEWVRVEPRLLPPRGPLRPAVALRLLDFPTLLVRPPEPGCPPGRLVPFGRGKSCLFRLGPGPLRGLLRRAPLYALLLALPPGPGPARLLGSCCVSLAPAAEELLRPPQGGVAPDSRGRRGRYPLRDLMGERVGELALGYRLSSLGPALLGHLPADLGQEVAGGAPLPSPTCPPDTQCKSGPRPQGTPGEQVSGHSRHCTSISSPREPQDRDEVGELEPEPSGPASSSIGPTHPPSEEEVRKLEIEANIFCPPPLYYSHLPTEPSPPQPPGKVVVQPQAPQEQIPSVPLVPLQEACPDRGQASSSLAPSLGSAQLLRNALRELPLINALLVELSLLTSQPLQLGPSTVHPQLAWLYREVEDNLKPSSPLAKSRWLAGKDKETLNPSETFKKSQQEFSKLVCSSLQETGAGKGTKKATASGNNDFEKKSGTKEKTPPRKKLFYGLTHTLRLRLQQTNPDMLILHERREQYRKRQVEMLREKKGKGSLSRGKLLRNTAEQHLMSYRHPAKGGILEQNTQLHENIETLIQRSVEKDYSTTKMEDISNLQKHARNRPNNHEENTKEENPYEVNTNSSLEGTTIKSPYKVKGVNVHLPRAFTQDTDAKRNKVDEETVQFIHDKDMDDYNASTLGDYHSGPKNSFESNPELKYSDDFVGSPENTGYSEDFTSADDTGRGSETLDSSPEPALVSPKQACSDMDSESKKSRLSEKSLRTESIAAPLPVPSTASPVHSLKRTYDLKAKKQSTGVAVSVSISDSSPPTGSLDKQELAPHIKEEDSKIDQNIFQTPEVKSKQTNSDMNNVVKGQTSLEKSQSLRTSQVSSYLPSNMSDLELSGVENNTSDKEEDDDFGTLNIPYQYKHISELVVNKLPGYTV
ncbi:microtubule-associated protein 10 [Gopherus evgoodei]|uniref:microtubule-associated protein 10 n=1 Tax=Gopherus evgoodei TaxID=1825980 RepID=UPI0011CEFB22|nr:microtubule-associated protein 10 [Gopherus evgoodei]